MPDGFDDRAERRFTALAEGMSCVSGAAVGDFDWSRPVSLPVWLPRRLAGAAVTQFWYGEIATARACGQLHSRLTSPTVRDILDRQAEEERRHAEIYLAYLRKIGGLAERPPTIARTYEKALTWPGAPEGVMLAFHAVLEGESLRLQQVIDKWMPCPLFRDISAAIARDEGRHIAFGRTCLRAALPHLPRRERLAMFRWVRNLWMGAVRDAVADFAPPGLFRAGGGYRNWVSAEWRERLDDMEALGLFTAQERQEFAAP